MRQHLTHELLWEMASTALTEDEAKHLKQCARCQSAQAEIQIAQAALSALPEAPPLPMPIARKVGHALTETLDAQAAKRFSPWWSSWFSTRGMMLIAAALVALVVGAKSLSWVTATLRDQASPVANGTVSLPASEKLVAAVISAKKSSIGTAQTLSEGSTITTQKGGSAWLKLPDGSRAGLTAASAVTLVTLEKRQLTLDLVQGNLAMMVPHREDRVLTVRAGDIAVVDLGTRFLVAREPLRTVVAVEEGRVEVITPSGRRELTANHALTWRQGKLVESTWDTAPRPPPTATQTQPAPHAPAVTVPGEIDLSDMEAVVTSADEWASLPDSREEPPPHLRPQRGFSWVEVERRLRELGTELGTTRRGAIARAVTIAADAGDCRHALSLAERWLRETPSADQQEPEWRRSIQQQQLRCLNHLGRLEEASAVQRALESSP